MTLEEIKRAVDAGECVCWYNTAYKVKKDRLGQYLIAYRFGHPSSNYVGLTHNDGVTLQGNPDDFFIAETVVAQEA